MSSKKTSSSKVTEQEIKQLVIERLRTLPSEKAVSIGSEGSFTKEELIRRVGAGDQLGKKVEEMEIEFLRAMKNIAAGDFVDEPLSPRHST